MPINWDIIGNAGGIGVVIGLIILGIAPIVMNTTTTTFSIVIGISVACFFIGGGAVLIAGNHDPKPS